jgi:hypothetical protein
MFPDRTLYDECNKHRYPLPTHPTLQMHFTENPKQIFPEMKLHSIFPNFYISKSWENINRLQIHEWRNCERAHAVSFLRIFVLNFRYSAGSPLFPADTLTGPDNDKLWLFPIRLRLLPFFIEATAMLYSICNCYRETERIKRLFCRLRKLSKSSKNVTCLYQLIDFRRVGVSVFICDSGWQRYSVQTIV